MAMIAPCMKCTFETGRHPGCHAECEKYIEWTKQNDEKRKKLSEAKTIERLNSEARQRGYSIRRKFRKG